MAKAMTAGKGRENPHNFVLEERVDRSGFEISKCAEYFSGYVNTILLPILTQTFLYQTLRQFRFGTGW